MCLSPRTPHKGKCERSLPRLLSVGMGTFRVQISVAVGPCRQAKKTVPFCAVPPSTVKRPVGQSVRRVPRSEVFQNVCACGGSFWPILGGRSFVRKSVPVSVTISGRFVSRRVWFAVMDGDSRRSETSSLIPFRFVRLVSPVLSRCPFASVFGVSSSGFLAPTGQGLCLW